MRSMVAGVALVAGLAGLAGLAGIVRAAETSIIPDQVIAARQAGFDLQQGVAAAMKSAIEQGGPVRGLSDGAKGLSSWGHVIASMFPDGTQTGRNTKAKAEVWSDRAGFEQAAETFYTQAEKLVVLADADDKAGFAAQFKATTEACGACHRQFKNR